MLAASSPMQWAAKARAGSPALMSSGHLAHTYTTRASSTVFPRWGAQYTLPSAATSERQAALPPPPATGREGGGACSLAHTTYGRWGRGLPRSAHPCPRPADGGSFTVLATLSPDVGVNGVGEDIFPSPSPTRGRWGVHGQFSHSHDLKAGSPVPLPAGPALLYCPWGEAQGLLSRSHDSGAHFPTCCSWQGARG